MDPVSAIGGAASLITLIILVKDIAKTGTRLIKELRGYSKALIRVRDQALRLETLLNGLNSITQIVFDLEILTSPELEQLTNTFLEIYDALLSVQQSLMQYATAERPRRRISWAVRDEGKVKMLVKSLESHTQTLNSILIMLNVRLTYHAVKTVQSSHTELRTLVFERSGAHRLLPTKTPNCRKALLKPPKSIPAATTDCTEDLASMVMFRLSYLAHIINTILYFFRSFGFSFQIQLSTRNFLPENAEIFIACKNGDVLAVLNLLETRAASPQDCTPQFSTPLRYAIESGSLPLVQLLLDFGADPQAAFGKYGTLPISWAFAARKLDIASLLISRGAAIDDVSLKGWSPHFYLFGGLETSQRPAEAHSAIGPCTQYLEALNCASYQEYNMQDDLGWTGMHRAAIYGTAADIEALIKYGASSLPRTKRLQWSPIFMAVYYSNISTFRALSTHRQGYVLERDIRGWTLLHVAAASGCGEIIEQLLQDGADVHARGDARAQCVPDGLRGYPVTPLDVALDAGVNAQSAFVQAVAAHDRQVKILEDGNEKDLFWVAEEGISTGS